MTPDTLADAETAFTEAFLLEAGSEVINVEAGEGPQGPGPGDETVMSWARAM